MKLLWSMYSYWMVIALIYVWNLTVKIVVLEIICCLSGWRTGMVVNLTFEHVDFLFSVLPTRHCIGQRKSSNESDKLSDFYLLKTFTWADYSIISINWCHFNHIKWVIKLWSLRKRKNIIGRLSCIGLPWYPFEATLFLFSLWM